MPGFPFPKFGIDPHPMSTDIPTSSLPPTNTPPLPVHHTPSSNKHTQYQTYLSHLGSKLQPCSKPKSMSPEHKRRKPFFQLNISVLIFPSDFFLWPLFYSKPLPMSFIPIASRLLLFCTPPSPRMKPLIPSLAPPPTHTHLLFLLFDN